MATVSVSRPRSQALERPDPAWRELYRVGGACGLLCLLLYLVAMVLVFVTPSPSLTGGEATLQYIASNRWLYLIEQVLWLGPSLLLMLVFLALYVALKDVSRTYAAIGGVVGVVSWGLALALPTTGGGSPALIYLSDEYTAATSAAQRAGFVAAAEGIIAQNNIPSAVGILTTLGMLILGLVMLRGVFSRPAAYLTIATGGLGVISEILRPVLGAGYAVYGVFLLFWFGIVGWQLYRLGRYTG